MNKQSLSVVLATKNEEKNIGECLESVKGLAEEIIVFDEDSIDDTKKIAKKYGAKTFTYKHEINFHETKQKAIERATCEWVLQLDADERVSKSLAEEIRSVIKGDHEDYIKKISGSEDFVKKSSLFSRHQTLIESRQASLGKQTGEIVAYFVPRLNFFLGKPLLYAGVYPDGVIRLFRNGKAHLPAKTVHELMEVDGKIGWLYSDLLHFESPTLSRYLERANRYTDITAAEFKEKFKSETDIFKLLHYSFFKPLFVFVNLYLLHKGFLDGMRGFIWSAYSALHYPIAYFKYYQEVKS